MKLLFLETFKGDDDTMLEGVALTFPAKGLLYL